MSSEDPLGPWGGNSEVKENTYFFFIYLLGTFVEGGGGGRKI